MEEINYCRTCHSSQQNSLIDIFQNNYDKLYNDLTQLPISEDDMYSKFICSTCIKELNHWEDFKKKCINSLEDYFKEVISMNQKLEIKQELSEEPFNESESMLHSILDIKEEVQEPLEDSNISDTKSQRREREYQKFIQENPIEKVGKVFCCSYNECDKFFLSADRFEIHLRAHFKLGKILSDEHHNKIKKFKCDRRNCRYKTHLLLNLETHLRIRHGISKNLKCKYCSQTFRKDFRRKQHEETHFYEKKEKVVLTCDHCGQTYTDKYNLKMHLFRAHTKKTKSFTCDLCPKTCWTSKYLEKHKEAEHSSVICRICKFKCSSKSELLTHRLEEHKIQSAKFNELICDVCGKKLSTPSSLRLHKESHNKEKKFKCNECDYATTVQFYLDNHVRRIHSTSRPFACDQCGITYPCESMLNYHMINHTKERNYICPTCNKSFKTDGALRGHQDTHNIHRPFICEVCKLAFKSKPSLKKHSEVHKEVREPVQCDLCGKSYASKKSLRSHKATSHATSRPFECDKCNLNFVTRVSLNCHMKVHSDVRDVKCHICGATFKHQASLFNHMKGHKKNQQVD